MSDNVASVVKILDPRAKYGVSQKTGKDWSMARVELNNGESAFIFNPVDIGDAVEKVRNGEFENWQKLRKPDPKHEEIIKKLDEIIKILTDDTTIEPPEDL